MKQSKSSNTGSTAAVSDNLAPDLKAIADAVAQQNTADAERSLLQHYALGLKVQKVLERDVLFGSNGVDQLAAGLHQRPQFLYDLRRVTQLLSRNDIKLLGSRPMTGGGHITIYHLTAIANIPAPAERRRLLELVFTEGLTVAQLINMIVKPMLPTRKPSPRKKTPLVAAKEMASRLQKINALMATWNTLLLDELLAMPPDRIDDDLLDNVLAAQEESLSLQAALEAANPRFDAAIARAKRVLSLRNGPA
jgi:hypothetical protein